MCQGKEQNKINRTTKSHNMKFNTSFTATQTDVMRGVLLCLHPLFIQMCAMRICNHFYPKGTVKI